jgi:hypothetical protein
LIYARENSAAEGQIYLPAGPATILLNKLARIVPSMFGESELEPAAVAAVARASKPRPEGALPPRHERAFKPGVPRGRTSPR